MAALGTSTVCPQLLVSVRDADEARAALDGGCDILDVKDPSRGSLGMAPVRDIERIVSESARVNGEASRVGTSAALGEVLDWSHEDRVAALPAGLRYAKLGLAGLGRAEDWRSAWDRRREWFNARASSSVAWVAVVYADWPTADAPPPEQIVDAARDACPIVLLDTSVKNGRNLADLLPADEYARLAGRIQRLGMKLAVAGCLRAEHLSGLTVCPPDIVAIRTSACRGGHRQGRVCAERVREFKSALRRHFGP